MISFGDAYPADDNAIIKAIRLSEQWTGAWSTNDIALILPIVEEVRRRFAAKIQWQGMEAADAFASLYSEILHKEFVAELTIDQFRTEGRDDLGEHFTELCVELGRFDLQTSFLLFGHNNQKHAKLFQNRRPWPRDQSQCPEIWVIG